MNERGGGGRERERNCIVMDGYMLMNKKSNNKKEKSYIWQVLHLSMNSKLYMANVASQHEL